MPAFIRRLLLACAALLMIVAPAHAAPALPDTGLFAPVARQYQARMTAIAHPRTPLTAGHVRLLLITGQADVALQQLPQVQGDPREIAVLKARALLATQDFKALAPIIAAIPSGVTAREDERALRFAWLIARDDARATDSLTRVALASGDDAAHVPELLAAGRLAYDMLDYPRAESLATRALAHSPAPPSEPAWGSEASARRAVALTGLAAVQQKRRDYDGSLATLTQALGLHASADVLMTLTETLIRLGRTDDAISAAEWAVRLAPYNDAAHYLLGNGYARRNYTQLAAAYPAAFASITGRAQLARADSLLASGQRSAARTAYAQVVAAQPNWVDARIRLASLDFEDGRFAEARDGCFAALAVCPEYGRAHAVLAKALEGQRFEIDVHRADYEARFAATPMPSVPGIEQFVQNWRSLSPRHQKRVALSVAPWRHYLPVLIAGGATYYIKPLYMLLSDCPAQEALRDTRINYDSRLWDDVRGCGGYHTVTGIEDVERTIFDRYNTVVHELSHQVAAILPPDDGRDIQEHYRLAKRRDDATHDGYLSRYAGGSVYEYWAEGVNSLESPMRDAYDPREVVRERLVRIDPDLKQLVEKLLARTDVSASYPIAYAAGGDDHIERGQVREALPLYRKALTFDGTNETALVSLAHALVLGNRAAEAESIAARAVAEHPKSGPARTALAEAQWHAGDGLTTALRALENARESVQAEDRYQVDLAIGDMEWSAGDAPLAIAAFDLVLAYQSDNPEGLQGRAEAFALAGRTGEAFPLYDQAVRVRTGVVGLRCDYARDLLRVGRVSDARAQLAEAALLDEQNPTAEALRAWADLRDHQLKSAYAHAKQALEWGPWCDLAVIVKGAIEQRAGDAASAHATWAPLDARITKGAPPAYVFRPRIASWEEIHTLPVAEQQILAELRGR